MRRFGIASIQVLYSIAAVLVILSQTSDCSFSHHCFPSSSIHPLLILPSLSLSLFRIGTTPHQHTPFQSLYLLILHALFSFSFLSTAPPLHHSSLWKEHHSTVPPSLCPPHYPSALLHCIAAQCRVILVPTNYSQSFGPLTQTTWHPCSSIPFGIIHALCYPHRLLLHLPSRPLSTTTRIHHPAGTTSDHILAPASHYLLLPILIGSTSTTHNLLPLPCLYRDGWPSSSLSRTSHPPCRLLPSTLPTPVRFICYVSALLLTTTWSTPTQSRMFKS